jgi:eukaryotic-like serine/threonine-protein kinase
MSFWENVVQNPKIPAEPTAAEAMNTSEFILDKEVNNTIDFNTTDEVPAPRPQSSDTLSLVGHADATIRPEQPAISDLSVPGYILEAELGRGGMGVVYRARQIRLNRLVALKMVLAGEYAQTKELLRFMAEAETVARLHHPDIVQVHEIGQHAGRPFVVLEYIDGGTLADRLNKGTLRSTDAALLIERLARAVQHAHSEGVVHRDLKPANILMTKSGEPKVTDFGLAKRLDIGSALTESGAVAGTPAYMAPEQALGRTRNATVSMDIYSLGAILYECLSGRPPFIGSNPVETMMKVVSEEPTPLSRTARGISVDLVTICMRCLEKDPRRRYSSAEGLANDLRAYLDGRPISARRISEVERAWKWAKRRPGLSLTLLALTCSLILGTILSSSFAVYASNNANLAAQREQEATVSAAKAIEAQQRAERAENASRLQTSLLLFKRGIEQAERGQAGVGVHWMLAALKQLPNEGGDFQQYRQVMHTNIAAWTDRIPQLVSALPHPDSFRSVAFSPDGQIIASGCDDGCLRLWNRTTEKLVCPPIKHPGVVRSVVFLDGTTVLTGHQHQLGDQGSLTKFALQRWESTTGKPLGDPVYVEDPINEFVLSGDGRKLLICFGKNLLTENKHGFQIWDAKRLSPMFIKKHHDSLRARFATFSPDSKYMLMPFSDHLIGELRIVDATSGSYLGEPLVVGQPGACSAVFTPDQSQIWAYMSDGKVRGWRFPSREPIPDYLLTDSIAGELRFSHDGRKLHVIHHKKGESQTFEGRSFRRSHSSSTIMGEGVSRSDSTDEKFYTINGENRAMTIWKEPRSLSRALPNRATSFVTERPIQERNLIEPKLKLGAVMSDRGILQLHAARLLDLQAGAEIGAPLQHDFHIVDGCFSPNGKLFATGSFDSTAKVWSTQNTTETILSLRHQNYVSCVAFSPDGKLLAEGDYGPRGQVLVRDVVTGQPVLPPLQHMDIVLGVQFSPDGKLLATSTAMDWSRKPMVQLWDVATGRRAGQPLRHEQSISIIRFSPDGRKLFTSTKDLKILIWDVSTSRLVCDPITFSSRVTSPSFSPDGMRFACGTGDGVIRLFSTETGKPLSGSGLSASSAVVKVVFSPDGMMLLAGYQDGSARLWNLATRLPVGPPVVLGQPIFDVSFIDPRNFATLCQDGTSRIWPIPETPIMLSSEELEHQLQVFTGMVMTPDETVVPLDPSRWQSLKNSLPNGARFLPELADERWHEVKAVDAEQDQDWFAAIWHLERLRKFQPDNWRLTARIGWAKLRRKEKIEAKVIFDELSATAPKIDLANWFHHRAIELANFGDKPSAIEFLNRVSALNPKSWQSHINRATLMDQKDPELENAIEAAAKFADSTQLCNIAEDFALKKQYQKAIRYFQLAVERGKITQSCWYTFAGCCLKAGDQKLYATVCKLLYDRIPRNVPWNNQVMALTLYLYGNNPDADWNDILNRFNKLELDFQKQGFAPQTPIEVRTQYAAQISAIKTGLLLRAGRTAEVLPKLAGKWVLMNLGKPADLDTFIQLAIANKSLQITDRALQKLLLRQIERALESLPPQLWRERLLYESQFEELEPIRQLELAPTPRKSGSKG